jgi:hypothetical protein
MRTIPILLALAVLAAPALAGQLLPSWPSTAPTLPEHRDLFYCQGFDVTAWPVPANSVDELEVADDLPPDLLGLAFDEVGFYCTTYVLGIGSALEELAPPEAITLNVYTAACPPTLEPAGSYTFDWDMMETELEAETDQYSLWWVSIQLPEPWTIEEGMSLGWICHTDRSIEESPPILVGPMGTYEIFGACGGWIDAHLFDAPRWTPLDFAWGEPMDLVWCLGIKATATAASSWGPLKSLY